VFPSSKFSFYHHIRYVHTRELIEKYGCVVKYCNNGTESKNAWGLQFQDRKSSHNGAVGRTFVETNVLDQMLYNDLRKVYMASTDPNIQWQGKRVSQDKNNYSKRLEENIYNDIDGWLNELEPCIVELNKDTYNHYLETNYPLIGDSPIKDTQLTNSYLSDEEQVRKRRKATINEQYVSRDSDHFIQQLLEVMEDDI
jgi:hypothetical protein